MRIRKLGYLLIVLGVALYTVNLIYDCETFINPGYVLILVIVLICIGSILIYLERSLSSSEQEEYDSNRLEYFITDGLRIPITVENCIIKENNYREEILDERINKYKLLDEMYDPIANTKYQDVRQSVIIYEYSDNEATIRMISRTLDFDATQLRFLISQGKVTLLIDRSNKRQYMFEIEQI